VVAILLEKYLDATNSSKEEDHKEEGLTVEEQLEQCEEAIEVLQKLLSMHGVQAEPEARKEFEEVLEDRLLEKQTIEQKYIEIERQKIAVSKVRARGGRVSQKVLRLTKHESRRSLTRDGWLEQASPEHKTRKSLVALAFSEHHLPRRNSVKALQFSKDGANAGTEMLKRQQQQEAVINVLGDQKHSTNI
jgi:hypothetical protein